MPRRSRAGDNVREAVLDAAEALLARHGYRKATMEAVARQAGLGKGTAYLHFANKQEVFLGTIDRIVDRLCTRLRARANRPGALRQRLCDMLLERVSYRLDCVAAYPGSLDEVFADLRPAYLARRNQYFRQEADVFVATIEAARACGETTLRHPRAAAETLLEATNSLLPYGLSPREIGDPASVARRVRRIAAPLVEGLLIDETRRRKVNKT
jgi:AcrR family transcriptional regulator